MQFVQIRDTDFTIQLSDYERSATMISIVFYLYKEANVCYINIQFIYKCT